MNEYIGIILAVQTVGWVLSLLISCKHLAYRKKEHEIHDLVTRTRELDMENLRKRGIDIEINTTCARIQQRILEARLAKEQNNDN